MVTRFAARQMPGTMLDYTKSTWGTHPYQEDLELFTLSVPQDNFRPLGYLLDTVYDIEGEDPEGPDSLATDKLKSKPATIYYLPAEPERLDLEWLASVGPKNPQTLIDWSNSALRQYAESIKGHRLVFKDDFPARVRESIKENQLEQRLGLRKREIVRIVNEQGVFPFLSVDKIVISQPKNLYQVCCECVLDMYFDEYGFGMYREEGRIAFAAPEFSYPEF